MTNWKPRLLVVLILLLIFGAGYSYAKSNSNSTQNTILNHDAVSLESEIGTLLFQIEDKEHIALTPSTFSLQIMPEQVGKAISAVEASPTLTTKSSADLNTKLANVKITVKLDMFAMSCGVIQFTMTANEQGIYYGEGIPVMPGLWLATATISNLDTPVAAAQTIELPFTFEVH